MVYFFKAGDEVRLNARGRELADKGWWQHQFSSGGLYVCVNNVQSNEERYLNVERDDRGHGNGLNARFFEPTAGGPW